MQAVREHGMEVALDYALNCSPDHPWVREHPEWFHHRPDGTIAYAENPPKKYQDIYPLNFWPAAEADRVALWEACKGIIDFWADAGRQDLPGGQPTYQAVRFLGVAHQLFAGEQPDIVLLAEAFTRPKIMAGWPRSGSPRAIRTSPGASSQYGPEGLRTYVEELAHGPLADYMRPNFWPNTPDILSGPLRGGPPSAFALRFVLAATLAPSYGVYSGYELCENVPASPDNEEYLDSEKYEIKHRDFARPGSLAPLFHDINAIRRRHPRLRAPAHVSLPRLGQPQRDRLLESGATTGATSCSSSSPLIRTRRRRRRCIWTSPPSASPWTTRSRSTTSFRRDVHWGAHPYVKFEPWWRVAHVLDVRKRPEMAKGGRCHG